MQEKEWLQNNRYYSELDEDKLKSVFYFSLIWNVYEKEMCGKYGGIGKHPKKHARNLADKIDENILMEVFNYFKNRYVLNGEATPHFITFEFNKDEIKAEVFECLSSANPSNKDKLKALLCIAFRLRNNLFHGEKPVEKLYEQNENFRQINLILIELINSKD